VLPEGYYDTDMQQCQVEKMQFKEFLEYRNQFELSQQARIVAKRQ